MTLLFIIISIWLVDLSKSPPKNPKTDRTESGSENQKADRPHCPTADEEEEAEKEDVSWPRSWFGAPKKGADLYKSMCVSFTKGRSRARRRRKKRFSQVQWARKIESCETLGAVFRNEQLWLDKNVTIHGKVGVKTFESLLILIRKGIKILNKI